MAANGIVEFFKTALGSRHRDNVRAHPGQHTRGCMADATRGAGDESNTVGEEG